MDAIKCPTRRHREMDALFDDCGNTKAKQRKLESETDHAARI